MTRAGTWAVLVVAATAGCIKARAAASAPARDEPGSDRRAVVEARAAVDLGCPADQLVVDTPYWRTKLYVASGCGRRAVYLDRPSDAGPVNLSLPTPPGALGDDESAMWRQLVVRGAQDLSCPEERVVPDIAWDRVDYHRPWAPRFPVVEGCGKRAIYDRHRWPPFCDPTILPLDP